MPAPSEKLISISWDHGLGDTANFCRLIPEYQAAGYAFAIEATPDKQDLFDLLDVTRLRKGEAKAHHGWAYPDEQPHGGQGHFELGSKIAANLNRRPLPNLERELKDKHWSKAAIWDRVTRYQRLKLHESPRISDLGKLRVDGMLGHLPRPIILLHAVGNTNRDVKSLCSNCQTELYRELLDRTDGTLVALDWDRRVPRLASARWRHLEDLAGCNTPELVRLIGLSDLLIGVDSGPLHVAGLTDTPALGLFTTPTHTPQRYLVPRSNTVAAVLDGHSAWENRFKRIGFNIVAQPGEHWSPAWIAEVAAQILAGPRYLSRDQIAIDVQLQDFSKHCRGTVQSGLSTFFDRHRSFDKLLRLATERGLQKTWVETGTIRAEEDWGGAGFSTYFFGRYLQAVGGTLHSVDLDRRNCQFAQEWCSPYGDAVKVHCQKGVDFLAAFPGPIDVLYLDSQDTTVPNYGRNCLEELQAALPKLHDRSLVLFDDTPWNAGAWTGKGSLAVPHLLHLGWRIVYAGYQVLLEPPASKDLTGRRMAPKIDQAPKPRKRAKPAQPDSEASPLAPGPSPL